jgi:hypothetical protein
MAYIGRQLVRGQNRIYDDISSSFNGSTTAFNLTIGGDATPPAQVNQLWIVLGGILQKPGTDFTVADAQVTFTTAPAAGLDFWAMIQGDTSDMNAPSDGSVTPTKIATSGDFAFPADVRLKDADGSHYVGLQAPSTVSSNLVWTLPAADGSANQVLKTDGSGALGWATDSALSFSNDANNRVVTGTGSGLNGEANLTYDGNNLALAVDANGEGINLTATGNYYPEIEFNANRSSANNTLGYLNAKWNNTEVASISFNAGADTTNKDDAYITFNTASAGTNTERMRLDSAGRLIIGHTTSTGQDRLFQIVGTTADTSSIELRRHSADAGAPALDFSKSRNATKGSTTIVNSGDSLGQLIWRGDDGNDFTTPAATIFAAVDGTPGANDMPGRLVFNTTADGASTVSERMRIDSSGNVGIATTSAGEKLDVAGNIRVKSSGVYKASHSGSAGAPLYSVGDADTGVYRGGNANELAFSTGGNFRALIDSSGRFLLGHTVNIGFGFRFQVVGTDGNTSSQSLSRFSANASGPTLLFSKSRNATPGSNTIVNSGDTLGLIQFRGDDGGDYMTSAAAIKAAVDGTPGANDLPGRLLFYTTADGANSYTERMRIDSTGDVKINDGDLVIGTSGHGIDFSATAGPNNGSGVSELLDDYEEGTWTPSYVDGGGSITVSGYDYQEGVYTKIGNHVYVQARLRTSGVTVDSNGTYDLGGLPFTSKTTDSNGLLICSMQNDWGDAPHQFTVNSNNTTARAREGISVGDGQYVNSNTNGFNETAGDKNRTYVMGSYLAA